MTMNENNHLDEAYQILISLGLPRAQHNKRSALCLLALLNLTPSKTWVQSENPLMGITPIMNWSREHYKKEYAANTRESVRDDTIQPFMNAGIALINPDKPDRSKNSPTAILIMENS